MNKEPCLWCCLNKESKLISEQILAALYIQWIKKTKTKKTHNIKPPWISQINLMCITKKRIYLSINNLTTMETVKGPQVQHLASLKGNGVEVEKVSNKMPLNNSFQVKTPCKLLPGGHGMGNRPTTQFAQHTCKCPGGRSELRWRCRGRTQCI